MKRQRFGHVTKLDRLFIFGVQLPPFRIYVCSIARSCFVLNDVLYSDRSVVAGKLLFR